MLKVVIVDDEPKILSLIKHLVDWDHLEIEIAGEAGNGVEAFDLIASQKPDIVITDIRMPGMDGMEIIQKTRELGMDTSFVIISGYKNFEYAKSALKYGVVDYLVKPINKDELNKILAGIRDQKLEATGRLAHEKLLQQQFESNRMRLRKQFIDTLMFEPEQFSETPIGAINAEYGLNLKPGLFQGLHFKIDKKLSNIEEEHVFQVIEKIPELIENRLSLSAHDVITIRVGYGIICLVNFPPANTAYIKKSIKTIYDDIIKYFEPYGYFDLTIGVGIAVDDFNEIKNSIHKAGESVTARIVLGTGKIIDISAYSFHQVPVYSIITQEKKVELYRRIEVFNVDGIREWIEGIFREISSQKDLSPITQYNLSKEMVSLFFEGLDRQDINLAAEKSLRERALTELDNYRSVAEIKGHILEFVTKILDTYLQSKRSEDLTPIRIAKQYIHEHYSHSITLEDIARQVNLSPVYLSAVFKKETGINFSDYLIQVRLEQAKILLKETQENLISIAEQVGYHDAKYFSHLFTKVIGIRPKDYRKLYT